MRSKFVARQKLSRQVLGPFWAALASEEARLPARLAAALLTLIPMTTETGAQAGDALRRSSFPPMPMTE